MHIKNNYPARNVIVLFLAFFVFAVGVYGQTPTPQPVEETIRVNTDLIQTNVTVVDKNNQFVDGLKREQFEVRVDGKPTSLEFFERVGSAFQTNAESPSSVQKPAANVNATLRERRIIFFVDDLHLSLAGVVLNDQGKQVADFKTGLTVTSSPQDAEQDVIYNNRTPLAPGIYQVRVGAREAKSNQSGTTMQWIEIPDLAKKQLALSDLLLGLKTLKKSDKPEDTQTQFSVDHKFARPLQLDFMGFIYNAARSANGEMNLVTKIEIFNSEGRAVVNTPMRPLPVKGIEDLARIPVTGAIKQQSSVTGAYLLRVTVNDLAANTSVVQQTVFTIE